MKDPDDIRKKESNKIPKTIEIFLPTLSKNHPAAIKYKNDAIQNTSKSISYP